MDSYSHDEIIRLIRLKYKRPSAHLFHHHHGCIHHCLMINDKRYIYIYKNCEERWKMNYLKKWRRDALYNFRIRILIQQQFTLNPANSSYSTVIVCLHKTDDDWDMWAKYFGQQHGQWMYVCYCCCSNGLSEYYFIEIITQLEWAYAVDRCWIKLYIFRHFFFSLKCQLNCANTFMKTCSLSKIYLWSCFCKLLVLDNSFHHSKSEWK